MARATVQSETQRHVTRRIVLRRCRVCDWEDEVVERGAPDSELVELAEPGCPCCHAPAELVTVLHQAMTAPGEKNHDASVWGRQGGLKGGPARAKRLDPERRREIALKAAEARWRKR